MGHSTEILSSNEAEERKRYFQLWLNHMQVMWKAFHLGLLDWREWKACREDIQDFLQLRPLQDHWNEVRNFYPEGFQTLLVSKRSLTRSFRSLEATVLLGSRGQWIAWSNRVPFITHRIPDTECSGRQRTGAAWGAWGGSHYGSAIIISKALTCDVSGVEKGDFCCSEPWLARPRFSLPSFNRVKSHFTATGSRRSPHLGAHIGCERLRGVEGNRELRDELLRLTAGQKMSNFWIATASQLIF